MIWMSWRQFRTQALVGVAVLAVSVAWLVVLGTQIRHTWATDLAGCPGRGDCAQLTAGFLERYRGRLYLLDAVLLAVPGLLGLFWGAPLVAREIETGTHRLVWNQSVTRRRWLAVKLLVVAGAAMVSAGLLSAVATWAASRYDAVAAGPVDPLGAGRFSTLLFGARDLAPVGYAAFALVLGAVLGLLLRRTVPAMALTLLLFTVVQFVVPNLVRPHLSPPVTVSVPMDAEAFRHLSGLGGLGRGVDTVNGLKIPGGWVTASSELRTPDGRPVDPARMDGCAAGSWEATMDCLGGLGLHVDVDYQPGDRYWRFQWLEVALFLAASLALAGLGAWRIQRLRT